MNKVEHLLKISICGNDVNECSMFDLVICEYIWVVKILQRPSYKGDRF